LARRHSPDSSIGENLRTRRQLRGWSIRHAASRAGVAHTTWSRIERGEMRTDRYLVAELAAALECSVTDLTGQPHQPADRQLEAAQARVQAVWHALLEIAPDEPTVRPPLPIEALTERMALMDARRRACDYAAVGQMLPDLLLDLHAASQGPNASEALRMLVGATRSATGTLHYLGFVAECALAAERCRQNAEHLDEPVPLAVSDWTRADAAIAGGSFRRALTLTTRAADDLDRHMEQETAPEVMGMLHLSSSLSVLANRKADDARAHIGAAETIAERTGETGSWEMSFGPTNVGIWRMGFEVSAGQPGRAVETARQVNPNNVASLGRQTSYYLHLGRALADLRGRDDEAVRTLLVAERRAPQLVRSSVLARETARFLLDRSERGSALRGLCERMGVAN
jgi:transcriptional regulator with XRE-family HTH domain